MKHSKCSFARTSVDYLGHVVSAQGVCLDPIKVDDVLSWPVPKNLKALLGFLGLSGFYQKFVKGYATLAYPLTELLKKDNFSWSPAAQDFFNHLKHALVQALVLALPNFALPFQIQTDASGLGIDAVLLQQSHPIAYFSKKLPSHLLQTSTYVRDCSLLHRLSLNGANTSWVIISLF